MLEKVPKNLPQFGLWVGGVIANFLMSEGLIYVNRKKGSRVIAKFNKALRKSLNEIADEVEGKYLEISDWLRSGETQTKLYDTLQSPDIDEGKFVKVFVGEGIDERIARKLFRKIQLRFLKILGEEGLKDDHIFRSIILRRTREIGIGQTEAQVKIDQVFNDVTEKWGILVKSVDRLCDLTEEIHASVESLPEQARDIRYLVQHARRMDDMMDAMVVTREGKTFHIDLPYEIEKRYVDSDGNEVSEGPIEFDVKGMKDILKRLLLEGAMTKEKTEFFLNEYGKFCFFDFLGIESVPLTKSAP